MWIIVTRNAKAEEVARTYLKAGIVATVGRAPDSTIFLALPSISRKQGRIELRNDFPVFFEDETSTGAQVNGSYLRGPTSLDEKSVLEISGFKITVERDPTARRKRPLAAATPAPEPPRPDWVSAAAGGPIAGGMDIEGMLAQRISGIRQHRSQNSDEAKQRQAEIQAEWKKLVESMRGFQGKLRGDPRVQTFAVNREETEIMLKITDRGSARGVCSLILARRHPEGKYPELDGAWLMEMGQQEMFYDSPQAAMEEFVHRLAPRLA